MSSCTGDLVRPGSTAFQEAVDAVKSGRLSVRQAAEHYSCARSTLSSHARDSVRHRGPGRPTTLSELEEKIIVRSCVALGTFGYPPNRDLIGRVVQQYFAEIGRPNAFPSGQPSKKWWASFFKRWPELTERKPQHLTIQRARCCTPDVIEGYFKKLQEVLADEGLMLLPYGELAGRLWNCDETGLCTSVTSPKVIVRGGVRGVVEVGSGSGRDHITVLACGSAVDEKLPPYVVYKAQTIDPAWMEKGPPGARYVSSDSGWMEFSEWFKSVFLPATEHLRKKHPVMLVLDAHGFHISLTLVTTARHHNTIIFCLPPHTTHILQPLDVSCFRTVKREWGRILKNYKTERCEAVVSKKSFPSLLKQLWEASLHPEHLVSGFRAAGIHPLNSKAIAWEKLQPSLPYANPSSTSEDIQSSATPITSNVTSIFKQHFQNQLAKPSVKGGRLRPNYYGESMTSEQWKGCSRGRRKRKRRKRRNPQNTRDLTIFQKMSVKDAGRIMNQTTQMTSCAG